jgi:triosephosphate isomerase (TIM)
MNKIVVANWKMNPQSQKEAEVLFKESYSLVKNIKNTQIIICPPFPFLFISKKFKSKKVMLGSQNVSTETEGSYTGEVSPLMLTNMGVSYVIVGHGERRILGETNFVVNKKILNLLKFNLLPILCVGESNRDQDGLYLSFVEEQIKESLNGVSVSQMKNIIIAYEPIWAIGKDATREATKEEFMEMKIFIKKIISNIYNSKIAHSSIIIYGGSVNPLNTKSFIQDGGADGLLVGRDSINPKKFGAILSALN